MAPPKRANIDSELPSITKRPRNVVDANSSGLCGGDAGTTSGNNLSNAALARPDITEFLGQVAGSIDSAINGVVPRDGFSSNSTSLMPSIPDTTRLPGGDACRRDFGLRRRGGEPLPADHQPSISFTMPEIPQISGTATESDSTSLLDASDTIVCGMAGELLATGNQLKVAHSTSLVWATNRQSLCDSLPEFKSHHGGIYTKDQVPHGVLFGQHMEIGDVMLGDKGVYHIGGGRIQTEDGTWTRSLDYKPKDFSAWEAVKETHSPILVIMDHRHPDFHNIDTSSIPRDPDMKPAFVVLGTFFVTEVWQEMGQDGNRNQYPVVKLMLQRIHTADKPSYWQGEYHTAQVQDIRESFMQYICGDCSKTSPVAFRDHPSLCLNHHCQSFFCVDGVQLQRDLLEYSQGFLDWIKPFSGDVSMIPAIIPPAPSKNNGEYGTELRFRTGLVCPSCKHCNSRVWFNYWKCGSCGLVQMAEPEPYPLSEIDEETLQHVYKLRKNRFFKSDQTTIFYAWDLVDKFTKVNQNSVRTTYLITEEDGTFGGAVVHERPSAAMMQASCGANELWNEIQQPGVAGSFRRYPAVCPGSIVQKLTRHFTQNFGFHYDYGVKVGDTSFEAAPDVVLKSLVQLSHMGKMAVEEAKELTEYCGHSIPKDSSLLEAWQQPNEVLVLAYMEKDKINYHDDGEAQLNGTISTLSLGSPATMKVRIKGKRANQATGAEKTKAILVLEVQLQHGDVVTMCDTRLQALTEHAIEPLGIRRFAMTSRVIKPDYYLEEKPAKKLQEQNMTVEGMKESARLPSRAATFTFEGTQLQIDNNNTIN